jgi:alkylhydroperoxidase family enzyme
MATDPRIPPVRVEDCDPAVQRLLSRVPSTDDGEPLRVFSTLAHHGPLFSAWLPFGGQLLSSGRLSHRDRELLILRTAWLCGAEYEWGHHVPLALRAGLTEEQVAAVAKGPADPSWEAADALLLTAVDELHADSRVGQATFEALAQRFDTAEVLELLMVIGHYHMVGFLLNSAGTQLEPGFSGFPE